MAKSLTNSKTRYITTMAILIALIVVLQVLSEYVKPAGVSINLALVAIIVGAATYGWKEGLLLGLIDGIVILFLPSTAGFFSYNPFVTIVLCLLKTSAAGAVAGLIFKLFKNKKYEIAGTFASSILCCLTNTLLFILGCIVFFLPLLQTWGLATDAASVFVVFLGTNFLIETAVVILLSPAIHQIYKIVSKMYFSSTSND